MPVISVLCPVYNEEKYIENVLRFFTLANPPEKDLFIIDGGSNDTTVEIVRSWMNKYPSIKLLYNPDKYVPHALNLGLRSSSGEIVVRLDAHTDYSPNYFEKIIETFITTGADIVGGPMNPVGKTPLQKAIAYSTSGWFGIGDSKFHDINFNGYVDSVYLGAWKREIFNDVGYFDERMVRNQDDEFHYRAKSKGKKIYLNSEIKSNYFPRLSYSALFKQYFQYGLYKPLVLKKIKSEVKLRHLIPLFFVLYLLSLIASFAFPILFLPLLIYLAIDIYSSFINNQRILIKLLSLLVYPTLHISYGLGFLFGFSKLFRK